MTAKKTPAKKAIYMKNGESTELKSTESTEISVSQQLAEFQADSNSSSPMTMDDLQTPVLTVLQKGSPQIDKSEPEYIEGAEAGMICNTLTGELFNNDHQDLFVIPVSYRKSYLEWKPDRGGFVKDYKEDLSIETKATRNDKGMLELENGNLLTLTAEYIVLIVDELTHTTQAAVIRMSSTQLKKSRQWNTLITQRQLKGNDGKFFPAPFFFTVWRLTTTQEQNDKGKWFGWKIAKYKDVNDQDLQNGMDYYAAAKALYQSIQQNTANINAKYSDENNNSDDENVM